MKYYIQRVNDAGELDGIPYELITCKDCKWYENDKRHFCGIGKGFMFEDDYCSDADQRFKDHD